MTTEQIIELSADLTVAEQRRIAALSARQHKWLSDPAGRRSRGARQAATQRVSDRLMDRLIAAVQSPDAPEVVRRHFAVNGPTYIEAARSAANMRRAA